MYLRGVAIAEPLQDPGLMCMLISSLGVLEYMAADYKRAIFFTERALLIARQFDNESRIIQALNNLGNMFFELGDYSSAKQLQLDALAYLPRVESTTLKGALLDSMGKILTACGDYPPACRTFSQGLNLIRDIEAIPLAVEMLVGVSELWDAMGESPLALSLVKNLVEHPAASHDVHCRAARLHDKLREQFAPLVEHTWQMDRVRHVIEAVAQRLDGMSAEMETKSSPATH
jgi:tetratricopeptide (TPR) repeat protein